MEHTIKDQSEFLASLTAMLEILFKDMHLCESHLNDGKPGWRRMYERAIRFEKKQLDTSMAPIAFWGQIGQGPVHQIIRTRP
jgi:hypothetical protein